MFTGIIQCLGLVETISSAGSQSRFRIHPLVPFENLQDGESIAVNGACLSVECHDSGAFCAYASQETLSHTNLGDLHPGIKVNLERALAMGDRLGGHLVSGHVDCVATISEMEKRGESLRFRIAFPREFATQIINRGSVALDGISLTVTACGDNYLDVNIIPDSQLRTNVFSWRRGGRLNMETDLIGKYVDRILRQKRPDDQKMGRSGLCGQGIDLEFLRKNGFA